MGRECRQGCGALWGGDDSSVFVGITIAAVGKVSREILGKQCPSCFKITVAVWKEGECGEEGLT